MSEHIIDEIVEMANGLSPAERRALIRHLEEMALQERQENPKANGLKPKRLTQPLHPNTIWIKKNKHRFPGRHVAPKDGKLIADGRTIKEADQAAKAKGVNDPLLHYILAEDEEAWGGW